MRGPISTNATGATFTYASADDLFAWARFHWTGLRTHSRLTACLPIRPPRVQSSGPPPLPHGSITHAVLPSWGDRTSLVLRAQCVVGGHWANTRSNSLHYPSLGPLRRQVIQFITGTDLSELPELQYYANGFMFMPNLEVNVERLHAQIAQRTAITHNVSPAYISTQVRKNEILEAHSSDTDALVRCCEMAPDRRLAVRELGLVNHPSFVQYRTGDSLDSSVPQSSVNAVLGYSLNHPRRAHVRARSPFCKHDTVLDHGPTSRSMLL